METLGVPTIKLIIQDYDGHKAEWLDLFSLLLPSSVRVSVPPPLRTMWWARDSLLFLTLDDHPLAFLASAVLRSALGRQTTGIFLRPGECFLGGRLKYQLKRVLFQIASQMPRTSILTIIPFSVDLRFAQVATDWIDDPQLWDLSVIEFPLTPSADELSKRVRDAAGGREVVLALGGQSRIKGFDFFSRLWCSSENIREKFLFCAAGAVAPESEAAKVKMLAAGGLVIDKRLEIPELLNLYRYSSLVWSCYARNYNQGSGVFSRAFQFGTPTIIRSGSYLEKLAAEYNHPYLAVPFDDLGLTAVLLLGWHFEHSERALILERVNASRERTKKILQNILL